MEITVSLFLGLAIYSCIIILFNKKGMQIDDMNRRLSSIINSNNGNYILDEELSKPLSERLLKPILKNLLNFFSRLLPGLSNSKDTSQHAVKLKKSLARAGLRIGVAEFRLIRLLVIAGLASVFAALAFFCKAQPLIILLAAFLGIYAGYAITRFYLTNAISKRKRSMEQQLPDVLDLLSISVEAGLGFEQAINQIISHFEGPLIDELAVTYREMSMGRTRREAMILLGERCDIEEIKNFVSAVVQAGQLGISMKNVLKAQSVAIRQARKNKIQEKAMKISVKILVPMVVFIFPVLFIVLLGPAAINIFKMLG